ncbi:MAG: DUF1565 domain-containing protein [Phormidesmis sp.]
MFGKHMLSKQAYVAAAIAANALLLPIADVARAQTLEALPPSRTIAVDTANSGASYQTLYVDPTVGSDRAAGRADQPLQTVTRALELAPPNTVIVLAPGRYTQATGEIFPLRLKSGVTIQGTPGERDRTAIIEGGGNFESPTRSQQNAAIVAADRAGIAQIAVSNPDGYGLWIESVSPTILESAFVGNRQTGIYVAGGSPRVQGSYFSGNQVAGLIVFGASTASIQSNIFDGTGDAIRVVDGATPEIVGNRMTNNEAGLVLVGNANPVLRDNQMVGNRRNDVVEVAARTRDISASALLATEEVTKLPQFPEIEPVDAPIYSYTEADIEADQADEVAIPIAVTLDEQPAGAPGAALAALRSGVALAPRAVTGDNPDSPILNRRRPQPSAQPSSPIEEPTIRPEVRTPINNNRLAVPNSDIPVGSGGSSIIFSAPNNGVGAPPAPPSRAQALGLYYRVFVEASDPFEQDAVKKFVPDAFRTRYEGRAVMQVGAFPTEDEAEDRRRFLEDNNFDVRVEYIR